MGGRGRYGEESDRVGSGEVDITRRRRCPTPGPHARCRRNGRRSYCVSLERCACLRAVNAAPTAPVNRETDTHCTHESLLTAHPLNHYSQSLLTAHCSLLTTHYSMLSLVLLNTQYAIRNTQCSLPKLYYSPLTTHHLPLTTHNSLLTTQYSPLLSAYYCLLLPAAAYYCVLLPTTAYYLLR